MKSKDYNWPGWDLKDNSFGKEFDLSARKRMVKGSNILLPFVLKYKEEIGKSILEIGPFFNPLITLKMFPKKRIFYLDNDIFVLEFLEKKFGKNVEIINCDIDRIPNNMYKNKFDAVILSHVLNYVDYVNLFRILKKWMSRGGYVFINNVVHYGIPELFSNKRPKNDAEIVENIKRVGFEVLETKKIPTLNKKTQKNQRMILIARNGIAKK